MQFVETQPSVAPKEFRAGHAMKTHRSIPVWDARMHRQHTEHGRSGALALLVLGGATTGNSYGNHALVTSVCSIHAEAPAAMSPRLRLGTDNADVPRAFTHASVEVIPAPLCSSQELVCVALHDHCELSDQPGAHRKVHDEMWCPAFVLCRA